MSEEYVYEGIAVTTIDVVDSPTPQSPKRVTFSASTLSARDDTTALFIHKIKEVMGEGGKSKGLLEAEKLSASEVTAMVNSDSQVAAEKSTATKDAGVNRKVLFTVHGMKGDPKGYLLQIKGVQDRFKKFKLVPVLWPSRGWGDVGYLSDKVWAVRAGKALQSLIPVTSTFSKSLICHSMGNRVLRYFSNGDMKFDNIFMVAADVDWDLFNQDRIDGGKEMWRKDALRICDMVDKEKGGKVHVVFNKDDAALSVSNVINMKGRIGKTGLPVDGEDTRGGCFKFGKAPVVHPDVEDTVVNVNWTNNSPSESHNFQFDWEMVAYYERQYIA